MGINLLNTLTEPSSFLFILCLSHNCSPYSLLGTPTHSWDKALSHEWVGVPKSEYGEQLWDRQSIKRNEDGSVRVLSKFIPKTKSEITKDILYTMDINCFEKSFRDVDVSIDEVNSNFNDLADWQDPNGDELILGVIGQVCRVEN